LADNDIPREGPVREPDCLIVFTTLPLDHDAATFAATLVSERLAACVSVLGEADSTYTWEGRVERSRERQVLIKTTAARWPALVDRIGQLHPYAVPEILAVPISDGLPAYLQWVSHATI
jgi:periplasmic divalent cation tolerance protein